MNCLPQVIDSLAEAVSSLCGTESALWVERLSPLREQLLDSRVTKDADFTQTIVNQILSYFETQGSLNDVWISDASRRERVHAALGDLFMWCLVWDRDSAAGEAEYRKLCAEWRGTSKDPLLRSGVEWQRHS